MHRQPCRPGTRASALSVSQCKPQIVGVPGRPPGYTVLGSPSPGPLEEDRSRGPPKQDVPRDPKKRPKDNSRTRRPKLIAELPDRMGIASKAPSARCEHRLGVQSIRKAEIRSSVSKTQANKSRPPKSPELNVCSTSSTVFCD